VGTPRAVADKNAYLADIEDRFLIQRAPVPDDLRRTPPSPVSLEEARDVVARHRDTASHEKT
jgi:hypothetical protein